MEDSDVSSFSSRVTLADWVTAGDNPYFARAAVNRVWSYFFGTGLIDPVDEMVGVEIKASHVYEIEMERAGEAEVFFVPIRPGEYAWGCKGLESKGMAGRFIVK